MRIIFHNILCSNILPPPHNDCCSQNRNGGAVARKTRSLKGLRNHKGVKTPAASQLQNEMVLVSTVEVAIAIYFQLQCCLDVLFLVATNGVWMSLVQWSL